MNIAVVVRTLKVGGMERVAISLAEAFAENGHNAHLIYFKTKKETFTPKKSVLLHHFNLDFLMHISIIGFLWELCSRVLNVIFRKSYFLWKGLLTSKLFEYKLAKLEEKYGKFDLIIIRGIGTLEMIYKFKDDRLIFVAENVFSFETSNSKLKQLQINLLLNNRNIVTVSDPVKKNFENLSSKMNIAFRKLETITNPIDFHSTQELSNAYKPQINEPFILSVGRIVPAKNIPLLIEAYAYAKDKYALKHKLVIVGDGSDMTTIKKKIESLKINEDVLLQGQLLNPFPWMKHADLFVLSSKIEGLGMVLLEALACGTKVAATRSKGGVTDIMNGELTNYLAEQTPQALGEKIFEALNDKKEIYFESYLEKFKPEYIVHEYLTHFK